MASKRKKTGAYPLRELKKEEVASIAKGRKAGAKKKLNMDLQSYMESICQEEEREADPLLDPTILAQSSKCDLETKTPDSKGILPNILSSKPTRFNDRTPK